MEVDILGHNIAFIGFGGVGQGLANILLHQKDKLIQQEDLDVKVVAISDMMKGSLYHPDGLDVNLVLETLHSTGSLNDYPDRRGLVKGLDSVETIRQTNADTIMEVTFTDVKTGQPAIHHCETAFQAGKNVITTNKGPIALKYRELKKLAEQNGVFFGFEGTVMSGTPALRMPLSSLAGNEITEITGILNGTSNYILTKMEEGLAFDDALQEAKDNGFAEADPTNDIEGFDVRYKAVILTNYLMDVPIDVQDVPCEGISHLTPEDMKEAQKQGERWKLLATIKKENGNVTASVEPKRIPVSDPLASVSSATNAILYQCDLAGPITLTGAGAGITETGYSLLIDLIHIHRRKKTVNAY